MEIRSPETVQIFEVDSNKDCEDMLKKISHKSTRTQRSSQISV
jgi:hypothetical protein